MANRIDPSKCLTVEEGVRAVRVHLCCKECAQGRLAATGEFLASNPPQYIHVCSDCGNVVAVSGGQKFPRIEHRAIATGEIAD